MTVKQMIELLNKCPSDMPVCVRYESNIIEIENDSLFIDNDDRLCLFCDVDEKFYLKRYLEFKREEK
jgi:phage-related protein